MVVEPSVEEGSEEAQAVRELIADTVSLAPVLLLYKYIIISHSVLLSNNRLLPTHISYAGKWIAC